MEKKVKISELDFNKIAEEVRKYMCYYDNDMCLEFKLIIDLTIAKIATIMFTK